MFHETVVPAWPLHFLQLHNQSRKVLCTIRPRGRADSAWIIKLAVYRDTTTTTPELAVLGLVTSAWPARISPGPLVSPELKRPLGKTTSPEVSTTPLRDADAPHRRTGARVLPREVLPRRLDGFEVWVPPNREGTNRAVRLPGFVWAQRNASLHRIHRGERIRQGPGSHHSGDVVVARSLPARRSRGRVGFVRIRRGLKFFELARQP